MYAKLKTSWCSIRDGKDILPKPGPWPGVTTFIIIHSFYIALFSALEQTHCARRM